MGIKTDNNIEKDNSSIKDLLKNSNIMNVDK